MSTYKLVTCKSDYSHTFMTATLRPLEIRSVKIRTLCDRKAVRFCWSRKIYHL